MEKYKEVTGEGTKPVERVNNMPDLIRLIDDYLKALLDEINRRDIKSTILETKKNSRGEPTKHFKNIGNFKNFENFCSYIDTRIDLEKEQMFSEKCLIPTKTRLMKILHLSKPTLNRYEKIGIIEKEYGYFNIEHIREKLISKIYTDLNP